MSKFKNSVIQTLSNRRKFRSARTASLSLAVSTLALLGCQPVANTPDITPSTGSFTPAAEALYLERYTASLEAFKSGKGTVDYDTEVTFGDTLESRPIKRGQSALPSDVLQTLTNYAAEHNSDSFILYENGKITSEHYFGDTQASTLINAKSLAKPLGVIATGRAIKAGYIEGLDQRASDFIIEWKGTPKEAIKIKHLLDMRSGLLAQANPKGPEDVLSRAYLHPHHDEVIIHEYPLENEPGAHYEYANANSELVSVLISRATGQSYQDWVTKEVLSPLGAPGGKIWLNREGGVAHSGCCLALNSETYLKLAVMVMNNGQWDGTPFLPSSFIAQMTTSTEQNKFAGMGVYLGRHYKKYRGAANPERQKDYTGALHSEPYLDKDILLFDGNGNQVIYMLPSRQAVILRLGPRPRSKTPWDNAFLPNSVIRGITP